jgi:hypothetical protein
MAVAIPLLSIASAVGAGTAIAAGAAVTFGSFLTIAGGMASALGMLGKNKDMAKLGGILSLAGGITSAVTGAANAAGSGTATATGDAMDTAKAMTQGAEGGETLLTAPGTATGAQMPTLGSAGAAAQPPGMDFMTGIDTGGTVSAPMGGGLGGGAGQSVADSLMGRAQAGALSGGATSGAPMPQMTDFLSEAAKGMTSGDVAGAIKNVQTQAGSLWDKATGMAGKAGEWVQKNPYPAMMGLQAVTGIANAYSQQDAQDYQRSLIERARANLNSPVRMSFTPGG